MVALYSDPQGNTVFDKADASTMSTTYTNYDVVNISDDSVDKDKTIENLRRRITELESALSQNQAPENWFMNSFIQSVYQDGILVFLFQYCKILCATLHKCGTVHKCGANYRTTPLVSTEVN